MQKEIWVTSSLDKTMQPSLFYKSESKEKRPLLVGLHTWSYDRFNQIENMLPYAKKYDFNLLLPEFRGPNTRNNERMAEMILVFILSSALDVEISEHCFVYQQKMPKHQYIFNFNT
jgi:hypothetical protein